MQEIGDLSAHADQAELLQWIKGYQPLPEKLFLVHGEPSALEALRVKVWTELGKEATILRYNEKTLLFRSEGVAEDDEVKLI